jgi:transposase InsO family protein
MAIRRRGTGPQILHSDQGSTYSTVQYRQMLAKHAIRQSMSRKEDCWNKAPMESLFHSLKTELVMHCDLQDPRGGSGQSVRLSGSVLQPSAAPLNHQVRGSTGLRSINHRLIGMCPPLVDKITVLQSSQ